MTPSVSCSCFDPSKHTQQQTGSVSLRLLRYTTRLSLPYPPTTFLSECNRVLKDPLDYSHVKSAWSGLRPLVKDPDAAPGDTKKLR